MVVACHAWCLAMFPEEAQQAVWGDDPETLVASAFGFSTGKGRRVEGGYWVEGDWVFSSGSDLCQWIILGTRLEQAGPPKMIWTLLPRTDWEILDTWHAAGLKGSASNDIRVKGAFVPREFTLDISFAPPSGATPGSIVNPNPMYALAAGWLLLLQRDDRGARASRAVRSTPSPHSSPGAAIGRTCSAAKSAWPSHRPRSTRPRL